MGSQSACAEAEDWVVSEISSAELGDERLNRRLETVLRCLAAQPDKSIPTASRGWGETQAAYRFFDNEKVTAEKVLAPHQEATRQRMRPHPVVLCVEDTSELDFTSKPETEGLGPLSYESTRGIYIHPMLAVTPEGLCLGVLEFWRWVRDASDHGGKDRQDRLSRPLEQRRACVGWRAIRRSAPYKRRREKPSWSIWPTGIRTCSSYLRPPRRARRLG